MATRARGIAVALTLCFPELSVGVEMIRAAHRRARQGDPERGDAIQWVILTALGAAIAITVGTIIYNKLTNKANSIDVSTPGANQ